MSHINEKKRQKRVTAESYEGCKDTEGYQKQLEGHWEFQQSNYPDQLHTETAGAVHRVQRGAGGPVISDCSIIL